MNAAQNSQLVKSVFQAFGRGDIPAVLAAMHDEVVHEEPISGPPPFRGAYRGKAEVSKFFQQMAETVEVLKFEPQQFVAEGDIVVALGIYTFRSRSTGKTYDNAWAMAWQCRDGKIAGWTTYKDSATELSALRK